MEPVALQVRCSHCHWRKCNCADCRCAAVTAIRHPASAKGRSCMIRLTMGWHVLWSQWRCKSAAFTATDAGATAPIAAHSRPAEVLSVRLQVRCSHCHRRRCNCAGCRCAAVTAIRHPARARSQLIRLTMGWHVQWSQWRCSGHCDGSGLDASRLNSARADLLCAWAKRRSDCRRCDCHRRRCNCAAALGIAMALVWMQAA